MFNIEKFADNILKLLNDGIYLSHACLYASENIDDFFFDQNNPLSLFDLLLLQQSPKIGEKDIYTNLLRFGKILIKYESYMIEAFACSIMAIKCQINTPLFVICPWSLVHIPLRIHAPQTHLFSHIKKKINKGKSKYVELIEYFDDWKNFDPVLAKSILNDDQLSDEIGKLLAFDLYIGNNDRFIAIFKYIDEILETSNVVLDDFDHIFNQSFPINYGNFGFHNNKLYSIDHAITSKMTHPYLYLHVKTGMMQRVLDWLGFTYLQFDHHHRIMLEDNYVKWANYYVSESLLSIRSIIFNSLRKEKLSNVL